MYCLINMSFFLSQKVPPSAGYHVYGMSFPEAEGSSDPISESRADRGSLCRALVGVYAKW